MKSFGLALMALTLILGGCYQKRRKAIAHNNRGQAMLQAKDYDGAIEQFKAGLALDPNLAHLHFNLGMAYKQMTELPMYSDRAKDFYRKALLSLQKGLEFDSGYTDGHYQTGIILFKLNRMGEASLAFNQAIKTSPQKKNALAHYRLGLINKKMNQPNKAASHFRNAILTRPQFMEAYFQLAFLYIDTGNLTAAEKVLLNAIAAEPKNAKSYNYLGLVYSKMAETKKASKDKNLLYDKAVKQFYKAVQHKSSFSLAYWNLGSTLAKIQKDGNPLKKKDAVHYLNRFLQFTGTDPNLVTAATSMIVLLKRK